MPNDLVHINDSIVSEDVYFNFLPTAENFSLLTNRDSFYITVPPSKKYSCRAEGASIPFTMQSQGWLSLLLIFQFFIYFYAFSHFRKFWIESLKELFQTKERSSLFIDTSVKNSRQSFYLSFLTTLNLALFLYLFISCNHVHYENQSINILLFFGIVLLFFILRFSLLHFLQFVFFDKSTTIDSIWNSLFVLTSMLGVLLYVNVLFLIYSPFQYADYLFVAGFIFYILYVVLIAYRLIKYFYTQIYSFFYLILYLCTLEILPAVLLYITLFEVEQISL